MTRVSRRSNAEQASDGADLSGKNALVTGANTGLGQETARVLALRGAHVTMACRNRTKALAAKQEIVDSAEGKISEAQLDFLELDLNSLAAVRKSAGEFKERQRPLHLLINNAGIMIPMERRTDDGFEAHMGINHLGHFLFTNLLLDSLLLAKGARVVIVSSSAMGMATLTPQLRDLNWESRKFNGFRSYGDSKLMNLMFSNELNKRYAGEGIVANALHPGVIATELARDQSIPFMLLGIFMVPFMKTVSRGAATTVYVATSPDYERRGGLFFSDCREKKVLQKLAQDEDACAALWQRSCQMTGIADNRS
ncbi:MAG: SDR family oxidoreductase [Halieaceae bacterium]|nr:SDR family oxidoreductase [Halieaceae bacterium]